MSAVNIEKSWKKQLKSEFDKPYFNELAMRVREDYLKKKVYPPAKHIFEAFALCPFDKVRVVILGQDPYHGLGQANGLCFAVSTLTPLPPSLQNIFKEIKSDLGIEPIRSGELSRWGRQGVLLLNSVLTVLAGAPASHSGLGWEQFTDEVINKLNQERKNIVYMLWGKYAQNKGLNIDKEENLVLTSGHPSPYSAHLFFGNHHFRRCNEYLEKYGGEPIDWR